MSVTYYNVRGNTHSPHIVNRHTTGGNHYWPGDHQRKPPVPTISSKQFTYNALSSSTYSLTYLLTFEHSNALWRWIRGAYRSVVTRFRVYAIWVFMNIIQENSWHSLLQLLFFCIHQIVKRCNCFDSHNYNPKTSEILMSACIWRWCMELTQNGD